MALTPEEVRTETKKRAPASLVDGNAALLKAYYDLLKAGFPKEQLKDKLSNAEFRALAFEAVDDANPDSQQRTIHFPTASGGTVALTLDQLDKKIKEAGAEDLIKSKGADHLSQLVFTREQINQIAAQNGEAAAESINSKGEATPVNRARGAWNGGAYKFLDYWRHGTVHEEQVIPTAETVRDNTITRLTALGKDRPDIGLILAVVPDPEKKTDVLHQIADGMYTATLDAALGREGSKEDPLDKVAVKPVDEAMRNVARLQIRQRAYEEAQIAIRQKVAKKTAEINNGEGLEQIFGGGFFGKILGAIASFIFKLMPGVGEWLAKAFNMIPDDKQIDAMAAQTADSVSHTLASSAPVHNGKSITQVLRDAPDQGEGLVAAQLQADLEQNQRTDPNATSAFGQEHIALIAVTTAASVKTRRHEFPVFDAPASQGEAERMRALASKPAATTNPLPRDEPPRDDHGNFVPPPGGPPGSPQQLMRGG